MGKRFGLKRRTAPSRAAAPDRARMLAGVPVLRDHITIENERTADGGMVLRSRLPRRKGLLSGFGPDVIEQRIELDELGAFVVREIGKKKNVAQIVKSFRDAYSVSLREAEFSAVAFLKSLMERGVIAIGMRRGAATEEALAKPLALPAGGGRHEGLCK